MMNATSFQNLFPINPIHPRSLRRGAAGALTATALVVAGCSSSEAEPPDSPPAAQSAEPEQPAEPVQPAPPVQASPQPSAPVHGEQQAVGLIVSFGHTPTPEQLDEAEQLVADAGYTVTEVRELGIINSYGISTAEQQVGDEIDELVAVAEDSGLFESVEPNSIATISH